MKVYDKKKRNEVKHPNLVKEYNPRARQEYSDYDYIKDLPEDAKEYLNKFTGEFYGADLDFNNLENNLHNTEELKKDCTDRNNAQNRCQYTIAKASNRVHDPSIVVFGTEKSEHTNTVEDYEDYEDYLIALIDLKKKLQDPV